jgi:hypothetical protein
VNQRSPLIFWLLLAATLAVYAVLGCWVASQPFLTPTYAWIAFDALTFSMLSLVCMGTMFRESKSVWMRIAPVPAAVLASLLLAGLIRNAEFSSQFHSMLFVYGLHVALLILALWVLKRINFWQRRFGVVRAWQFSVADLLIVMTSVAVFASGMRYGLIVSDAEGLVVAMVVCTVILAVSSAVVWSLSLNWIIRLAGTMGIAILLGFAFGGVAKQGVVFARIIGVDFLIQAAVLSIWLGIGGVLPVTPTPSDDDGTLPHP